jgi:hypothetical protein
MRKVDGLSLVFIYFYVPALALRLDSTETSLQFSDDITSLRSVIYIYIYIYICKCHQQRDLDRHQVFGAYHLYIYCIM